MFRVITIASVVIVVALLALHRRTVGHAAAGSQLHAPASCRFPLLDGLAMLLVGLCTIFLAATGFFGASLIGRPLGGYLVLLHTACGGAFAGGLAALALLRAQAYSFGDGPVSGRFMAGQKVCFWLMCAAALALIFSMLAAMVPLLGAEGQHLCVDIHRYAALVALLTSMAYAHFVLLKRRG